MPDSSLNNVKSKNQNLTILSPLTSLTIQQSLISKLQNDLPIQVQFVNSFNELFLTIPKSTPDYIGIDIEELCKNNIQSFEKWYFEIADQSTI